MKKPQIHQFHSGSAFGDAITNSLFYVQQLLRKLGFESDIYVEHIAPELKDRLFHFTQYKSNPENVIMVHHSMGHDQIEWLRGLSDKKIIIYHNVTPAKYFVEGSFLQTYAIKGRQMLRDMKSMFSAAAGDSEENVQEMRDAGYENPMVLPTLLDQRKIATGIWNDSIVQNESKNNIILFVGRITNNKCQHDLVSLVQRLGKYTDKNHKLVLVGGFDINDPYYMSLKDQIKIMGLEDTVQLTGKISDEDLRGWYRAATLYVSMSEHEGFGVPFLESMLFDLPIVAYKCHAIPHVLGNAGIMFDRKNMDQISALLAELLENRALRRTLILEQRKRIAEYSEPQQLQTIATLLESTGTSCLVEPELLEPPDYPPYKTPRWQFEGPFETSYSLALVNRNLALAMDKIEQNAVALWATEGPGDYTPKPVDLAQHPEALTLHERSRKASQADVVVRNLWPPRLRDMDGLLNLSYFYWEESSIPIEIVDEINNSCDGLIAPTHFCHKIYVNNGIKVPITVVGGGCDHLEKVPLEDHNVQLDGEFRFLHVSSAFPRKGIDVLLRAFEQAFADDDKVVLVLKTFPNPHNTVADDLECLNARNPAVGKRIVWINKDISEGALKKLYKDCHAFVSATRGEGLGLPMLEAMLLELPVIATAKGGHADFCTEKTSWPVKCTPSASDTHLVAGNSIWFDPDIQDMATQMKAVRYGLPEYRGKRVFAAKALARNFFTWENAAHKTRSFASALFSTAPYTCAAIRIAFVTTWNSKCGIATYSKNLVYNLKKSPELSIQVFANVNSNLINTDESWISRIWTQGFDDNPSNIALLEKEITAQQINVVIIQFNFGFFNIRRFGEMLDRLNKLGKSVIICFHSTKDVNKPDLKVSLSQIGTILSECERLLVHSINDLERLSTWGLHKNVTLFPHGVVARYPQPQSTIRKQLGLHYQPLICTFGFCLPQKGLPETIEAFSILKRRYPKAHLLMLNAIHSESASRSTVEACQSAISRHGLIDSITFRTDFLPESQCVSYMDACDLAVFAYNQTDESASGAVKIALQAGCKVLCTPVPIFEDVKNVVHLARGTTPMDIAHGMIATLEDNPAAVAVEKARRDYISAASWEMCATRLLAMILDAVRCQPDKLDVTSCIENRY